MRVQYLTCAAKGNNFTKHPQSSRKSRRLRRRSSTIVNRAFTRLVCAVIAISLLCNSTPAAAQTIVSTSTDWRISFGFWLETSGTRTALKRLLAGELARTNRPETQSERNARVRRVHITPGQVTARIGEVVRFSAIAYGEHNDPIGGVEFHWRANGDMEGAGAISSAGEFSSLVHGKFNVSVSGAGKTAQTVVTVLEGPPPTKERNVTVKHFSTRNSPPADPETTAARRISNSRSDRKTVFQKTSFNNSEVATSASAPSPWQGSDQFGWNLVNYMTADDPGSQVGDPPGTPVDDGAGNGNFQISAPVLSLPGRGINISLALTYNAHLWHKAGNNITYDIDRGWPAPGWSFGFGKMADIGDGGSIVVEADGTRHGFNGTATGPAPNSSFSGRTNDGSFIDYACVRNNGVIIFGSANFPNGTRIHYGAAGDGAIYPTHIIDPNGNYVNVSYRNNSGPQIDTVTDTLGRVINFHYDSNNLLTAVTAPPLSGGVPRTLIRLHYQQQLINPGFTGGVTQLVRAPTTRWLLDAIFYPGINTGYWFGDSTSFLANYGMLAKVEEQRGMAHSSGGLTDMGTVTAGTMTEREVYAWQTTASNAPTYSTLTESWAHMDTSAALTTYVLNQSANPRTTTITKPNNIKTIQYAHNAPGQFNDGMVFKDEVYDTDGTTLLSRNEVTWETGDYNSARPKYTTVTTRQGTTYVTTGTEFTYAASPSFNQATEVRNYDFGYVWQGTSNVLLRKTVTQYENSSNYTNRHIFNLPKIVSIYSGTGTRVSQTEYTYDGGTLDNTPNVVQHLDESDPYAPVITQPGHYITQCTGCPPCSCVPVWIPPSTSSPYKPETVYRGNVTQIKTFADAANLDQPTAVVETRSYDMTGNVIETSTACCDQTNIEFTSTNQYAYPEKQTRGSASDAFLQVVTSSIYNFNTGLVTSSRDENDRPTQTSYFDSLRPQTLTLPTGAHADYAYDDAAMTITETKYLSGHPTDTGLSEQTTKYLNGQGQIRRQSALGASGVVDFVDFTFDVMGRPVQQSAPYRTGETKQWTINAYDGLGRNTRVTAPDGSVAENYYNGTDFDTSDSFQPTRPDAVSPTAPGETMLVRDAWGRERWGRADALGRLVEIVEANPSGNGSVATNGLVTTYSYNTLGNLTGIVQQAQTRSFKYDSLGRMTAQKLAEAQAMLNNAGTYVSSGGTWSEVFTYDLRSNLTSRTDARGVKTVYNYNITPQNSDPLNRLQSVSWDTSGFGDTNNPILAANSVTYAYRTKSSGSQLLDVTQVASVTTANVGSESYGYDSEGRVSAKTLTLNSRSSYPFVTDYIYDELNRIKDLRYPAEYGNGSQPRKVVHHDYDVSSRVSALAVDGQSFASNIVYNAASKTTSIRVGQAGSNQIIETYGYAQTTGLLESQTIARDATPTNHLLNLSYDYADSNGKRTGQLKKILNNLNHNKDRSYSYDALRRLSEAKGGPSGSLWTQTYSYDRYGNRTAVSASGFSAKNEGNVGPPSTALLAKNTFEPPPLLINDTKSLSDSPLMLGPAENTETLSPATPPFQGGPPTFTNDPLTTGIDVKAIHVTELRDAINLLRLRAGIATVSWAETVTAGVFVKASHITEMRTRLGEARTALSLAPTTYTDPGLAAGFEIKKQHIQEIRDSLKAAWNVSSQISRDGHASLTYEQASNRITTSGFAYDTAGNQVRALIPGGTGSQRFQYDAANRLVKVKEDNNTTVLATYTYGHSSARLMQEEGSSRTYFLADDATTLAEFTESGAGVVPTWSKSYVFLGGRLLSTLTPNGSGGEAVEHYHPDRLGTRLITNPSGTSSEQVTLPFGTLISSETTAATSRRFTTYDRSATSRLDYAVNRHYDWQQGRFTQADPIGMKAANLENPQTLNLYAYCGNDPVNLTDPDGLFWGKIKRFFQKLGKILTAVGAAISRVLNNRWVRIGVFILSFFLPGLQAVGSILYKVVNWGLQIYNKAAEIGSLLQLGGSLLQGRWKEFLTSVGLGIVSGLATQVTDAVMKGMQHALFKQKFDELGDLFVGAWKGFLVGIYKLKHTLSSWKAFVPWYGNYCSPAATGKKIELEGVSLYDNGVCRPHDNKYQTGADRLEADFRFVVDSLYWYPVGLHSFDIAFSGQLGGRPMIGSVHKFFTIPIFSVFTVVRAASRLR